MHIGITATRRGLTIDQRFKLRTLLLAYIPQTRDHLKIHHGDCVGGDAQAHRIARTNIEGVIIHAHPCDIPTQRANCEANVTHPVNPPLKRNQKIVLAVDLLIVLPSGVKEQLRSGTWATYRYAKKTRTPTIIIWPDGSIKEERYIG